MPSGARAWHGKPAPPSIAVYYAVYAFARLTLTIPKATVEPSDTVGQEPKPGTQPAAVALIDPKRANSIANMLGNLKMAHLSAEQVIQELIQDVIEGAMW